MRIALAAIVVFSLTLLLWLPAVTFGLVYEDGRDFAATVNVPQTWTRMAEQQIRPMTQLSRILDVTLFGIEPWGFHLSSVLWHVVNVGVVLALAWLVLPPWGAVIAAAVFAMHPLQTEAVTYVSARADLLSGVGLLLALWAASTGSLAGALVGVAFAFLAKETAIVAWGLVLLWAAWTRAPFAVRTWLVLGAAGVAFAIGDTWGRIGALSWSLSPQYAGEQFVAVFRLLAFLPLPLGLSIEHDWTALAWLWPVALGLAVALTLVALSAGWQMGSWWALGWLWTLVALAPRFVVPLDEGLHERHTYSIVFIWAVCAGAWMTGTPRERVATWR